MNQRLALSLIALGLLLAGYLDGQDANLMAADKDSLITACIHCAGQP
jgi:hypothetical protein